MFGGVLAALLIALVITGLAAIVFKRTGPWGTAWTFFLFLFLTLCAVSIYVRNVGPVYGGVAWLPLLLIAIILAAVLISVVPDANHWRDDSMRNSQTENIVQVDQASSQTGGRISKFFWFIIGLLVIAIIVGMVNPQMAL